MKNAGRIITRFLLAGRFLLPASIAVSQTPLPLQTGISIRKVITVENDCARIIHGTSDSTVIYARGNGDISEVNVFTASKTLLYTSAQHKLTLINAGSGGGGFAAAKNGTLFLCGYPSNAPVGYNVAVIARGTMVNGFRVWDTLAKTEPYLKSNTGHDHLFNAVEVSTDGQFLFVNSGSRTDHGDTAKMVNGGREYPITSAVFKLPLNGKNITLYNNDDSLKQYLFAAGIRNAYDMAISPQGELFGIDNSDVADDHEELNWIREGRHYGFPWRLGIYDNPQQFSWYDPNIFKLLITGINRDGSNYNDPKFPPRPSGVIFTEPILSVGPDADSFRDTLDGIVKDASVLGRTIGTFTPHGSPLGITFDGDSALSAGYTGDLFVLTYNDSTAKKFAPFKNTGEDLLHVHLTKIPAEDRYEASVTRIVRSFKYPVDAVLMKNRMYVIENGANSSVWEVILPVRTTGVKETSLLPEKFRLFQNFPNPFNPSTAIQYTLPENGRATLSVYDVIGRLAAVIVDKDQNAGTHTAYFDASTLASGMYWYRLSAGGYSSVKRMLLLR